MSSRPFTTWISQGSGLSCTQRVAQTVQCWLQITCWWEGVMISVPIVYAAVHSPSVSEDGILEHCKEEWNSQFLKVLMAVMPVAEHIGHPGTSLVLPVTLPKILCRVSHHQAAVDLHFGYVVPPSLVSTVTDWAKHWKFQVQRNKTQIFLLL